MLRIRHGARQPAWAADFMPSAETRRHLDSEYELLARMLGDLGVATR